MHAITTTICTSPWPMFLLGISFGILIGIMIHLIVVLREVDKKDHSGGDKDDDK